MHHRDKTSDKSLVITKYYLMGPDSKWLCHLDVLGEGTEGWWQCAYLPPRQPKRWKEWIKEWGDESLGMKKENES